MVPPATVRGLGEICLEQGSLGLRLLSEAVAWPAGPALEMARRFGRGPGPAGPLVIGRRGLCQGVDPSHLSSIQLLGKGGVCTEGKALLCLLSHC